MKSLDKNTAKTYQIELYFGINRRDRFRYHKMVDLYQLYELCNAETSYRKMRNIIYAAFRQKVDDDLIVDRFWNRFIDLQLEREEALREQERRIKQIDLENRRKGRAL
jgi:hypothetical protein